MRPRLFKAHQHIEMLPANSCRNNSAIEDIEQLGYAFILDVHSRFLLQAKIKTTTKQPTPTAAGNKTVVIE